jgi:UDP-N-acetylmuramoyl-L-alanyl-D-glutamate--2,6-diaminopimelate ligase
MTVGDLMQRLSDVVAPAETAGLGSDVQSRAVTAIAYDSRRVAEGAIFVAISGQCVDGAAFAADAAARGAVLVVSGSPPPVGTQVPWVVVEDARLALAELAAAFYGDPSHDLKVVGVTGTNGKTTTTYLLAAIFDAAGWRCGRIGSVGYDTGGAPRDAERTTPEASEVQSLLREMVEHRRTACAMEVSSHALAMRRVDQTRFAAAVFSNLTRDHLDYHPDMGHYFGTKQRLFDMLPDGAPAIINVDDAFGRQLAQTVGRPVTYAIDRAADVTPERVESSLSGTSFDVRTPRGRLHIRCSLPGRLNVYNVLAAVSAAVALDVPFHAIEQGVAGLAGVPGRFELVSTPDDEVSVVVDYAHTDDALRAMLGAVRELCSGRVITVFGCGGERDTSKRPLMGAVAARLSDLVVVTSDNPRSENPDDIIAEIRRGIASSTTAATGPPHLGIPDRSAAIERAIDEAEPGDAVAIAGKGHETFQTVGDERRPFDDRVVARAALARRRTRSRV